MSDDKFSTILTIIGVIVVICSLGAAIYDSLEEDPKEVYAHCSYCGWEGLYNDTVSDSGMYGSDYLCPKCMHLVEQREGVPNDKARV